MIKVKICGVTSAKDAYTVVQAGADMLGLIFVPKTPRTLKPDQLEGIFESAHFKVKVIGVFQNQPLELVQELSESLPFYGVQLHGDESPDYCAAIKKPVIKAFPLQSWKTPQLVEPYKPHIDHALLDWPKGKSGPIPWDSYPENAFTDPPWPKPILAGK